jgi:hypothetical protein
MASKVLQVTSACYRHDPATNRGAFRSGDLEYEIWCPCPHRVCAGRAPDGLPSVAPLLLSVLAEMPLSFTLVVGWLAKPFRYNIIRQRYLLPWSTCGSTRILGLLHVTTSEHTACYVQGLSHTYSSAAPHRTRPHFQNHVGQLGACLEPPSRSNYGSRIHVFWQNLSA